MQVDHTGFIAPAPRANAYDLRRSPGNRKSGIAGINDVPYVLDECVCQRGVRRKSLGASNRPPSSGDTGEVSKHHLTLRSTKTGHAPGTAANVKVRKNRGECAGGGE